MLFPWEGVMILQEKSYQDLWYIVVMTLLQRSIVASKTTRQ